MSLAPAAGKTEIVVTVRGAVEVRDFMLSSPDRLVLDVVGAKLGGTTATLYDGVKRGGVLNLRYSQFRPDIVRIVVDLDGAEDLQDRPRPTTPSACSFGAGPARSRPGRPTTRRPAAAPPTRPRADGRTPAGAAAPCPARKPD